MSPSVNFLLMLVFIVGSFLVVVGVMLFKVFKGRGLSDATAEYRRC